MPTIIGAPLIRAGEDIKSTFLKLLFTIAPAAFLDAVAARIDEEDAHVEAIAIPACISSAGFTAIDGRQRIRPGRMAVRPILAFSRKR
jgi:hypothetical protein